MASQTRYYSQFFRLSYKGPPPETPTTWRPEAFKLPTYEEVMLINELEDSMRLPTYKSRQLSRYHPYWQYKPSQHQGDGIKFQDTMYDDQYVPLRVPARVGPTPSTPPLLPEGTANQVLEDADYETCKDIEECWARAQLLRATLADFMYSFHRAESQRRVAMATNQVFLPIHRSSTSQLSATTPMSSG